MVSRYDPSRLSSTTDSTTRGQTTSTTNQSQQQTSSQRSTTSFNERNISAIGRQALDSLIAQLAAGGTPSQRAAQQDVLRTIQLIDAQRAEFSSDRALALSEEAVQSNLQRSLEAALPSILLAGNAAGTSGDALSALLTQDLQTQAAGQAAEIGIDAVTNFGQISAGLLQDRSVLSQRQDPVANALIQALNVDVGSERSGSSTTRTTGSATQRGSSTTIGTSLSNTSQTTNRGDDSTRERQIQVTR